MNSSYYAIDMDKLAAAARAEAEKLALAYAVEVCDLCVLAGFPDNMAGYLRRQAPLATIKAELTNLRADSDTGEIDTKRPTKQGKAADNHGWDRATDEIYRDRATAMGQQPR